MERSEIRDGRHFVAPAPDYAALHPGYENNYPSGGITLTPRMTLRPHRTAAQ
jgi:hypothetical protein